MVDPFILDDKLKTRSGNMRFYLSCQLECMCIVRVAMPYPRRTQIHNTSAKPVYKFVAFLNFFLDLQQIRILYSSNQEIFVTQLKLNQIPHSGIKALLLFLSLLAEKMKLSLLSIQIYRMDEPHDQQQTKRHGP